MAVVKKVAGCGWKASRQELAHEVGVSTRTIAYWMQMRWIPFYKARGIVRFDVDDVKAALERRCKVKEVLE